jgi:hypothetical protein
MAKPVLQPNLGIILLLHAGLIGCQVALTSMGMRFVELVSAHSYLGLFAFGVSLAFGCAITIYIKITLDASAHDAHPIFGPTSYYMLLLLNFAVMALTIAGISALA